MTPFSDTLPGILLVHEVAQLGTVKHPIVVDYLFDGVDVYLTHFFVC
jgi:hypothetical protein